MDHPSADERKEAIQIGQLVGKGEGSRVDLDQRRSPLGGWDLVGDEALEVEERAEPAADPVSVSLSALPST